MCSVDDVEYVLHTLNSNNHIINVEGGKVDKTSNPTDSNGISYVYIHLTGISFESELELFVYVRGLFVPSKAGGKDNVVF